MKSQGVRGEITRELRSDLERNGKKTKCTSTAGHCGSGDEREAIAINTHVKRERSNQQPDFTA